VTAWGDPLPPPQAASHAHSDNKNKIDSDDEGGGDAVNVECFETRPT
jgi:hypothetical protein